MLQIEMPDNKVKQKPIKAPVRFVPQSQAGIIDEINAYDHIYKTYDTPEKMSLFRNAQMHEMFEENGISSPFTKADEGIAVFNPDSKIEPILDTDTPEVKALKTMRNKVIEGWGGVADPSFLRRAVSNSMTMGWANMLYGKDVSGMTDDIAIKEDGIYFQDNRLSLDESAQALLGDYSKRISGGDIDKTFLDKAAEMTVGLVFDLPLMTLGNALASKMVNSSMILRNLSASSSFFTRTLGHIAEQGTAFNLLGIPQTAKSFEENGLGGALESVWHNVQMGTIGAVTGTTGFKLGRSGVFNKILPGRPALQEEIGAIMGSGGFGYLTERMAGASEEDALAAALSFSAMHFTNPTAYSRVIQENFLRNEGKKNNVFVETRPKTSSNPYGFQPDYFVNKDGKYYKINKELFKNEGRVEILQDREPIIGTEQNSKDFTEFWKVNDHYQQTFMQGLARDRHIENTKRIIETWKSELDPKYFKENEGLLSTYADMIATTLTLEKESKLFNRWKFNDTPEVHGKMVEISQRFSIPYAEVKEKVIRDIRNYLENPEMWTSKNFSQERRGVAVEISKIAEDVIKTMPRHKQLKGGNESGETIPMGASTESQKQLPQGKIPPERRLPERTAEEGEGVIVSTEGQGAYRKLVDDSKVYYITPDGEVIPVNQSKTGDVTEPMTGVTFMPPKESIKTEAEIAKIEEAKVEAVKEEVKVSPEAKAPAEVKKVDIGFKREDREGILTPKEMINVLRSSQAITRSELEMLNEGRFPEEKVKLFEEEMKRRKEGLPASEEFKKLSDEEVALLETDWRIKNELNSYELTNDPQRGKRIADMNETELTDYIKRIDDYIKTAIPDPLKRAEVMHSTEGRDELSGDVVNALRNRDAANALKHQFAAERRKAEGKTDIDISNVATPENRRKILAGDDRKITQEQLDGDADIVERITAARKSSKTLTQFAEKMGLPDSFRFLTEWADMLGVKLSVVKSISDPSGKSIIGGRYSVNEHKVTLGKDLYRHVDRIAIMPSSPTQSTRHALFVNNFTHELIHAVLHSKQGERVWKQIQPEVSKLAETIRKYYEEDLDILAKERPDDTTMSHVESRLNYALQPSFRTTERGTEKFFYELFTSTLNAPEVVRYLDHIPYEAKGTYGQTAWTRLVDWIRRIADKIYGSSLIGHKYSAVDEMERILSNAYSEVTIESFRRTPEGRGGVPSNAKMKPPKGLQNETSFENKTDFERETASKMPLDANREAERRFNVGGNTKHTPQYEQASERIYGENFARKIDWSKENKQSENKTRDENDIKATKPKSPEKTVEYARIHAEMATKDIKPVIEAGFSGNVKNHIKNSKFGLGRVKNKLKEYVELSIPPAYKAEQSKRFRENAYIYGEEMLRVAPFHVNRILLGEELLNGNAALHKLAGISGMANIREQIRTGEIKISPEAQKLLDVIGAYHEGRRTGQIPNEMSVEEVIRWGGLNKEQGDILRTQQKAFREAIAVQREFMKKLYMERDDIVSLLPDKVLKKFLGPDWDSAEKNKQLNENIKTKEIVVDYLLDQKYGNWGKTFYYNSVRPASPNTLILEGRKKIGMKEKVDKETGETVMVPEYDRISTYFYDRAEKEAYKEAMIKEGYVIDGDYRIKDLIDDGSYMNKLNAHQILELAIAGNVDLNDAVIRRLLDATKTGVDVHTINRQYVKGLKFTLEEFERQGERFIREAIDGSVRGYYMTKMERKLTEWKKDLMTMTKSGHQPELLADANDEYEYARRYMNQLKKPERTWADNIRKYGMLWQVGGLKPSFLYMQSMQTIQMVLPKAMQEAVDMGGSKGDGVKAFNAGASNAVKAMFALRAKKMGLTDKRNDVEPELVDIMQKLEYMKKINPTGMTELFADPAEIDFQYATGMAKAGHVFSKVMTYLGKGIEKFTRMHSAATFYELGKRKGLKGDELLNYIADGIDKTMSEWGKGGRAPLLDSKGTQPFNSAFVNGLAKSFMTYKTYGFYNYGMWTSMLRNKQFAGLATKMMVGLGFHGIKAFPLMASLMYVAQMFTEDDVNYEMWKLADMLDKEVPMAGSIVHRGIHSVMGLDMSDTFGESVPLIPELWAESWSKSWEGKLLEIGLGAPFGFSKDMIAGTSEFVDDVWKQVLDKSAITNEDERKRATRIKEKMLPVFIRNAVNAMRYEKDGIEYKNKTLVMREDLTPLDVALKFMSFPIEKQTRMYAEAEGGDERKYEKAKQVIEKGSKHRKELVDMGLPQDLINQEMERVAEAMREARETIKDLEPKVREIRRKRKLSETNKL